MQNLTLISNSLLGGNIVTILARQVLLRKARQAAAAFQTRVVELQHMGSEIEYQQPDVYIGVIPISVKKQEAWAYQADVTQHAVESGAILTDHVILHPVRVDISFEVTNWDLALPQRAHDLFVQLWSDRTPLELQTTQGILKDMILTSYQATNAIPNWGSLEARASFTQIKFINLEVNKITPQQVTTTELTGGPDVSKSASTEVKKGRQTPKEISGTQVFGTH
jgi:hypothetical protein